jgi:AcrR family transcriptional regulator
MATSGVRRTRLSREVRQEQILDAAEKLFACAEPSSVSFDDIARAAGVSRALVYNYFADRDVLVEAICLRHGAALIDAIALALVTNPSLGGRRRLELIVAAHVDYAYERPQAFRYLNGEVHCAGLYRAIQRRIDELTAAFDGDAGTEAVAAGVIGAITAMVARARVAGLERARTLEVVTSFLYGALLAVGEIGIKTDRPFAPAI